MRNKSTEHNEPIKNGDKNNRIVLAVSQDGGKGYFSDKHNVTMSK